MARDEEVSQGASRLTASRSRGTLPSGAAAAACRAQPYASPAAALARRRSLDAAAAAQQASPYSGAYGLPEDEGQQAQQAQQEQRGEEGASSPAASVGGSVGVAAGGAAAAGAAAAQPREGPAALEVDQRPAGQGAEEEREAASEDILSQFTSRRSSPCVSDSVGQQGSGAGGAAAAAAAAAGREGTDVGECEDEGEVSSGGLGVAATQEVAEPTQAVAAPTQAVAEPTQLAVAALDCSAPTTGPAPGPSAAAASALPALSPLDAAGVPALVAALAEAGQEQQQQRRPAGGAAAAGRPPRRLTEGKAVVAAPPPVPAAESSPRCAAAACTVGRDGRGPGLARAFLVLLAC